MQNADQARRQLDTLAAAGIRLAIDDFGTGYSSLAYMQDLPAHIVKIDQSFVRKLGDGARASSLGRSMIGLSHDLGYWVVAESIETADQLRAMAYDEAQGYLLARPLEIGMFSTWLQEHQQDTPHEAALAV